MKLAIVIIFIVIVIGIFIYLGKALSKSRRERYGVCWKPVMLQIRRLLKEHEKEYHKVFLIDQCQVDLSYLGQFIEHYRGSVDIDQVVETIDPDNTFINEVRKVIYQHWHFKESPFQEVLEIALIGYNEDKDYHISLREFVLHLSELFDHYYLETLLERQVRVS